MSYSISSDVVSRTINGEEVILHLSKAYYFGLNEVGTNIWNNIKQNKTDKEIIDNLCTNFEVDETTAQADLDRFLNELLSHEMLIEKF